MKSQVVWLRWIKKSDSPKFRLFCFPYAGAGPEVYRPWAQYLGEEVELVAVHYPGRESRGDETACTNLPALIDGLVPAMRPHLAIPFAFFGHSMGAYVAFLTEKALVEHNLKRPQHLFFSGARAPFLQEENPVHQLDKIGFLKAIIAMGGIPDEVKKHPELIAQILPILRADLTACESFEYRIRDDLGVPFTVLGGDADPRVSTEALSAWRQLSSTGADVHVYPGDHFFLNQHRAQIAALINQTVI
ncbi:thioesterase II family protein [Alteromonas sp. a30]|uniref:thioesterase II family protein n=1 Tax=Alteromonas sp. a30 TaxID=2730917 RepID=UPI0022805C77|nr:alpha/beta fold hydrolase [Alteromonas sp. a30]MCY7294925.1 thioesterase [Alteromonas sp. a30]